MQLEQSIWNIEPPWSEAQIHASVFRDFQKTRATIDSLTGGLLHEKLGELKTSLNIFTDSVADLRQSIGAFKVEATRPGFWSEVTERERDTLEVKIQRGIFSSSSSAMALVDHTRAFADQYPVERYEIKTKEAFANNPEHRFVHSLRRCINHVRMTPANWTIKTDADGTSVFFTLTDDILFKWGDWHKLARQYIENSSGEVNVDELFESYIQRVNKFHRWFSAQVWEKYHADLSRFYAAKRAYERTQSQSSWNLLVRQVALPSKLNPYEYIGTFLTEKQLEEVLSLPFRSRAQVDRIISLVDEYGACDSELRENIHKLFSVKT